MRPVVLHHLIIALFASLATIYSCYYPQPTLSLSSSVFRKSPSITSIGSQLISSRTSTSNNASSASTCSKISALIFEIFTALCLSSQAGYDVILKMISEVKGEQYRFERLVQALQDLGIITKPDNLLLYDCAASALAFFNAIVQTPRVIEKRNSLRTELERRGLEAFLKVCMIGRNEL
jgi:hypothetical protein